MLSILAEKIHDGRFLRLVEPACSRPGIWRTGGGTPRSAARRRAGSPRPSCPTSTWTGWTSSSNRRLLPEYNRGRRRRRNRAYQVVENAIATGQTARRPGGGAGASALQRRTAAQPGPERSGLPAAALCAVLPTTGCWGSPVPSTKPRRSSRRSRRSCATSSSWNCPQSKTLITHATSQAARFLGYEIRAQHADTKITRRSSGGQRARSGCSCPGPSSGSGARAT